MVHQLFSLVASVVTLDIDVIDPYTSAPCVRFHTTTVTMPSLKRRGHSYSPGNSFWDIEPIPEARLRRMSFYHIELKSWSQGVEKRKTIITVTTKSKLTYTVKTHTVSHSAHIPARSCSHGSASLRIAARIQHCPFLRILWLRQFDTDFWILRVYS